MAFDTVDHAILLRRPNSRMVLMVLVTDGSYLTAINVRSLVSADHPGDFNGHGL